MSRGRSRSSREIAAGGARRLRGSGPLESSRTGTAYLADAENNQITQLDLATGASRLVAGTPGFAQLSDLVVHGNDVWVSSFLGGLFHVDRSTGAIIRLGAGLGRLSAIEIRPSTGSTPPAALYAIRDFTELVRVPLSTGIPDWIAQFPPGVVDVAFDLLGENAYVVGFSGLYRCELATGNLTLLAASDPLGMRFTAITSGAVTGNLYLKSDDFFVQTSFVNGDQDPRKDGG